MVLPYINPSSYIPCYISKEKYYYYYHHSCPISLFLYHFDSTTSRGSCDTFQYAYPQKYNVTSQVFHDSCP